MGLTRYFWDSYAVIEVVKGNINYAPYRNEEIIITIFNLTEIYYSILRDFDKEKADEIYEKYYSSVIEVSEEIIKEAMEFKLENKGNRISYADAIGYIYAKRNNLVFLTGDKEFEDLENVEFVKK